MSKPIIKVVRATRPPARRIRDLAGARTEVLAAQSRFGAAAKRAEGRATGRTQRAMARRSDPRVGAARRELRVAQANLQRVRASRRSKGTKARLERMR
jgi:hypothetical protein